MKKAPPEARLLEVAQYIASSVHLSIHWNDLHRFSREEMADWVALVEPDGAEGLSCTEQEAPSTLETRP